MSKRNTSKSGNPHPNQYSNSNSKSGEGSQKSGYSKGDTSSRFSKEQTSGRPHQGSNSKDSGRYEDYSSKDSSNNQYTKNIYGNKQQSHDSENYGSSYSDNYENSSLDQDYITGKGRNGADGRDYEESEYGYSDGDKYTNDLSSNKRRNSYSGTNNKQTGYDLQPNEGYGWNDKYADGDGSSQANNSNSTKQHESSVSGRETHSTTGQSTQESIWRVWSWTTSRMQYQRDRIEREVREAGSIGLTDVVLHLNSARDSIHENNFQFVSGNSQQRTIDGLRESADRLREIGADLHLMVFPAPRTRFTETMIDAILPVVDAVEPRSLLLDAEGNWRNNRRQTDVDGSVALINDRLSAGLREKYCALGFTDFMLIESGRTLAQICDYVLPQAYSTQSNDGNREPGDMQQRIHEAFRQLDKPIVMALAAWNLRQRQGHRGESVYDVMRYTFNQVREYDVPSVKEIAYWSIPAAKSGRFNSPREQSEIMRFLHDVCAEVSEQHVFVPGARFL